MVLLVEFGFYVSNNKFKYISFWTTLKHMAISFLIKDINQNFIFPEFIMQFLSVIKLQEEKTN